MTKPPALTQFRVEVTDRRIAHLIFDCPGRTMNVFSEAAIVELGAFAAWLAEADVVGAVIRSGKDNAFCAGADLTELGVAYDMIMAAPPRARFTLAYDHFFRLSTNLRSLETAGKPVAAAIAGLALGGGCELAMAAHYRVLVDLPGAAMGVPESLVGLLPGGGGTQRLPRLVGIEASLPLLLEGARTAGAEALAAGLVNELVDSGDEVRRAEEWILSRPEPVQPWDRDDRSVIPVADVAAAIAPVRERVLRATSGHYPAPLAILDCVEQGLSQVFDGAIRTEMAIFAHLIQREEARNMIQTMFLGKTDFDRLKRKNAVPGHVPEAVAAVKRAIAAAADPAALSKAGIGPVPDVPVRTSTRRGYWLDTPEGSAAAAAVREIADAAAPFGSGLRLEERRVLDYAVVAEAGFPAYTGGPLTYRERPDCSGRGG
jgi:3-hydroxyacyl-CoA dehydrogenase/enoyl-CoA hydratase/3-hydroxybutyryl-CoA epimerase